MTKIERVFWVIMAIVAGVGAGIMWTFGGVYQSVVIGAIVGLLYLIVVFTNPPHQEEEELR